MKLLVAIASLICWTACGSGLAHTDYNISGTVTAQSAGLAGVTVTLSATATGTAIGMAATDTGGNYHFSGLTTASYSVYPSKSGYSFTPAALPISINTADSTGNNFSATVAPVPTAVQLPKTGQTISYYTGR